MGIVSSLEKEKKKTDKENQWHYLWTVGLKSPIKLDLGKILLPKSMSRIKGNVRSRRKDILSDRSPSQTISEKNGNPKRLNSVVCEMD